MTVFMLVAYIITSVMLSAAIGKGRYYLQRTTSGRTFRRSYYGAWVEKLFAGLSTVGFSSLIFIPIGRIFAYLSQDNTAEPYFFSIYPVMLLALVYYQFILMVAKRCENDYRRLKIQEYTLPYRVQNGKKIVDTEDILAIIAQAQKTMSQRVIFDANAELDIIDPTIRPEMKRIQRSTRSRRLKIEASRRHQGWGIVRRTEPYLVIGNLALEGEKTPTSETEPQASSAALPIVNLKLTPKELLELQLAVLPEEDRELIEQLFVDEPVILRLALKPNCTVRFSIIPATDAIPRHIQLRGIVYHGRV